MVNAHALNLSKDKAIQWLIGFSILFVYAGSLFFPLLDKDAAHHANIALHMYEHRDYVRLIDRGKDYLDKPHFLFWTTLAFFKLVGVGTFAHRFPALLFTLVSIYSIYRLTKHLSDSTTAKIAALVFATAQGVILGINDARMETPLTAGIAFGLWQLIVYIDNEKISNIILAAVGAAVAFSTKGWLGPVIIFLSAGSYVFLQGKWAFLKRPATWLFIPVFFILISPVLYAYYLQFDLHPEKIIRGEQNRSGVKFILWNQLSERATGFDEGGRNSDYFFLYHTFLWAFFPWSIAAAAAIYFWFRRLFRRMWSSPLLFSGIAFGLILFAISFSKFKMPHYIIMLLPLASIMTAGYLRDVLPNPRIAKAFSTIQVVVGLLIFFLTILLNFIAFTPVSVFIWIVGPIVLAAFIFISLRKQQNKALKFLYVSGAVAVMANFFVNYNFFPNLLKYQGGNELVKKMKATNINIPDEQIIALEPHAHSFDFYRKHNHVIQDISEVDTTAQVLADHYYLITPSIRKDLEAKNLRVTTVVAVRDFNIARLSIPFINPKTRNSRMDSLMLARIAH